MTAIGKRPIWLSVLIYLILTITSLVILYPLTFMLTATFTSPEQYYRTAFFPIPDTFDFHNYTAILTDCSQGCITFSIVITAARALWYIGWAVLVSLLGGYVFARLTFPFKNGIFLFFLTGLMVPPLLTTLPLYIMLARFPLIGENDIFGQGGHGFVNSWQALGLTGLINIIALFLVKQSFEMMPGDYEEAARVDGAGTARVIFQIYLPMLRPALTAVSILEFVAIWNDYLWPLIIVGGNKDVTPVALTVQRLIYAYTQRQAETVADFPLIFAAATLMSIPTIFVYLVLQRYFVQGLVGVGVKG
jgi:multiple sugar transport system permease protein